MTDVVYILGDGAAELDDRPLRWSLRSLAKYATNVGRVVVCGRIPAWLSDEVTKVPTDVTTARLKGKGWNILYGHKAAIEGAGLTDPYLFSADDHYLTRAADLDQWPRYFNANAWDGELLTYGQFTRRFKRMCSQYELCLVKTGDVLRENGMSTRRAQTHLNSWCDPEDVMEAVALAEANAHRTVFGFETLCLVNGCFEERMAELGETPQYTPYAKDGKARNAADCEAKANDADVPGFTTTPAAERDIEVVEWMEAAFPTPCKWEKEVQA